MALGFGHACRAGISFGKDDMVIPGEKRGLVEETDKLAKEYEQQYIDGLITQGEKYNKVVDAWAKCTDRVADVMMQKISAVQVDEEPKREKQINSLHMMAHSGARCSPAQMTQLARMPGPPASAAYTDEAHAMTRKGKAELVLGISLTSAVIGGIFGSIVLATSAPLHFI